MYIKEFEMIEITISDISKTKWEKKIGKLIENNNVILHWSLLKGTTFRTKSISVICDDCKTIHDRRIRDLDVMNNIHYCKLCYNKGDRNVMYGTICSDKNKIATKKWLCENGNPFTWESSKEKIRIKNPWVKISLSNKGKKRTEETKELQSKSAILAFKEGRRSPTSGWSKKYVSDYKGIKYQSKYELNFLLYLESIGKLFDIENGPVVPYIDIDGREHMYFIDFKIKNKNIVFEIKSSYYWEKKLETNILKQKAASEVYNYHLIMDNNFNKIEDILNEKV